MPTPITNTQDVIDSRDVIERIAELEGEASRRYDDEHPEGISWGEIADSQAEGYGLEEEELAELFALRALAVQGADYCADWEYGEALIHDAYFVTYAQELADDIGAIKSDAGWPLTYIDWVSAADALKMDYTALDFDGATYWAR
jgi:hypothetical protein